MTSPSMKNQVDFTEVDLVLVLPQGFVGRSAGFTGHTLSVGLGEFYCLLAQLNAT